MNSTLKRVLAVVEVILVAFGIVPALAWGILRLLPAAEAWQKQAILYVVAMAVPLLLVVARRKWPAEYGIDFRHSRYHLNIMLTCFFPVALSAMAYLVADEKSWLGALILTAVQIALLLVLAWLLRRKPSAPEAVVLGAGMVLVPVLGQATASIAGQAIVAFLTYALFVGFGEEILYRGYVQSRLNEEFGRPFTFFGVSYGWGTIITAILFGAMHVGIYRWIIGFNTEVTLAWGFWTIFGGLVFSLVREKTGSILAPALLHGLPQAIASAAMVFMR
jgi:CAAX protease family protein